MVTQGGWSARDTLRNAQDKEGLSPLWETSKKGQGGRDKSRRQPGGRHGALWWPISSSLTKLSPPHRLGLRGWFAAHQESPSEASESRYQGQSPMCCQETTMVLPKRSLSCERRVESPEVGLLARTQRSTAVSFQHDFQVEISVMSQVLGVAEEAGT